MARQARGRATGARGRSGKKYKWCGGGIIREPDTFGTTSRAEVIELCPALTESELEAYSDVVIERCHIHIATHRLLISPLDAFGIIVWLAQVQEFDNDVVQVLDSLGLTAGAARQYGNRQIMFQGQLPVPRVNSLDAQDVLSNEVLTEKIDIKVRRKLHRSNEILALSLNTDVDAVLRCFVQWRVLLSYGSK